MDALQEIGAQDAAQLSDLHRLVFLEDGWSEADWRALLAVPGAFGWLSSLNAEPSGFLLARHAGGEAEILTLGVLESARRRACARQLVGQFKQALVLFDVRVAYLEVAESNRAAYELYRGEGFKEVGRRDGYYKRKDFHEAALILRWSSKNTGS